MIYYPYMRSNQDETTIREIAAKLREYRLMKNLKQSDLAEKAGLNSNYYAKVERGEATPSVVTLRRILEALGIKSSKILPF